LPTVCSARLQVAEGAQYLGANADSQGRRLTGRSRYPSGFHQPEDIFLQHQKPDHGASNWLPAPDGNFQLVLRTY
jgi:hypothetical protein